MNKRSKQIIAVPRITSRNMRKKFIEQILEFNNGKFYHPECTGCGEPLDLTSEYAFRYGFCSVDCGNRTCGLSCSDFM